MARPEKIRGYRLIHFPAATGFRDNLRCVVKALLAYDATKG